MSTSTVLVILGTFLASAVEMVEALTIVLGVGIVRGWRSTLIGVGAALIVLAALVTVAGIWAVAIGVMRIVLAFELRYLPGELDEAWNQPAPSTSARNGEASPKRVAAERS